MKILALFPGQGSQRPGMGKDLWDNSDLAREFFAMADKSLGFSLSEICFRGEQEQLMATEIAQPAILTISSISFRLFTMKAQQQEQLVAAAGHSLGEYSALVAAGALKFKDAVLLVHKRGKFMQAAVPRGQGMMAAILGKEVSEIEEELKTISGGVIEIANINCPGQVVIAGHKKAIEEYLERYKGAKSVILPVSAPFHCKLMKPAEEQLRLELAKIEISEARFPVYSNFTGKPMKQPEEIRSALLHQVCGRVRWVECIQDAISLFNPSEAVEFGYGNALSGMLKRIAPELARRNFYDA